VSEASCSQASRCRARKNQLPAYAPNQKHSTKASLPFFNIEPLIVPLAEVNFNLVNLLSQLHHAFQPVIIELI
jgi:hypothetical protein